MAAYLIAEVEVTDPTTYEEYRKLVEQTLEQYGGTYRVRGGAVTLLTSQWKTGKTTLVAGLFRALAAGRESAATPKELLADCPPDHPKPSLSNFYNWLNPTLVPGYFRAVAINEGTIGQVKVTLSLSGR